MKSNNERGSQIAKNGFKNERDVIDKFNNWRKDKIVSRWLEIMGHRLNEIKNVVAVKINGSYKSDIQVQVKIFLSDTVCIQNIQVKLVSISRGFNQIDRRWIKKCVKDWDMSNDVANILRRFTGELSPSIKNSKNKNRMFMNEFSEKEQLLVIDWFEKNKKIVVSDILKGRGEFSPEWMLVVCKNISLPKWVLKDMNYCIKFFKNGEIKITPKGSIKLGKISIQRKGGDGGKRSASQLQFKINPLLLFEDC